MLRLDRSTPYGPEPDPADHAEYAAPVQQLSLLLTCRGGALS
jgi:hypothetical protein